MIDWWWNYDLIPPDWSGVAGLAAVCAALYVGSKQIQISNDLRELQQKIATDDLQLRQQSLRIELLDRRSKCVAAMREIVGNWQMGCSLSSEDSRKFGNLLSDAELIYPPDVVEVIKQAVDGTFWAHAWAERSQYYYQEAGNPERGRAMLGKSLEEENKALAVMPKLVEILVEHTRVAGWKLP